MENAGLVDPDTGSRADHTLKLHRSIHVLLESPVSRQIGVTLWGLRNHCVEWGLRNHCDYVITALLVGNFLEIRYIYRHKWAHKLHFLPTCVHTVQNHCWVYP